MHQAPPVTIDQYRHRNDKEKAIFFVGRTEVVAGIAATVAGIDNRIKAQITDSRLQPGKRLTSQETWLIQGAPGAGKSALLSHLEDRWAAHEEGPVTVRINPNDLRNEDYVTRTIADCIVPQQGAKILHSVRTVAVGAGLDLFIQAGGEVTESEQLSAGLIGLMLGDLARLYSTDMVNICRRLFKGSLPQRLKLRPIVVMIDEVQMFEPEDVPVLRKLHAGDHGLPIVALLCGLADSESMLAAARISRFAKTDQLSHIQTLPPLATGEAAEAVRVMLNSYRIKNRRHSDLPDKIDVWCDGWPQFLEHYMIALTRQLSTNGLDLAKVDESTVRSEGDLNREEYYRDRLKNSPVSKCTELLAEVAQVIGVNGIELMDLEEMLEDRFWLKGSVRATMPKNMEPLAFIEAMIVAGVVHRMDTVLTIPIPSFRQFLIDRVK